MVCVVESSMRSAEGNLQHIVYSMTSGLLKVKKKSVYVFVKMFKLV